MAKDNVDKAMAAKVAKVREVITNVSKNDIILALHSHDLDVERTIAALTEGGALDEWECAGGSSSKNKKKSSTSKKPAEIPKSAAPAAKSTAPVVASTHIAPSVPLTSQVKKAPDVNGVNGAEKKKVDVSSVDEAVTRLSQAANQWQKECSAGKKDIIATMKSLREVVEEREKILLAELARQEAASSRLFSNHGQTIENLKSKAATGKDVGAELKAITKQQEDLLTSNVFSYDMTSIVNQISSFGRVFSTGVLPTAPTSGVSSSPISPPPMKHSGSRSSLVSSVGDDSGLGQGSPVPPEKVAKPVSGGSGPIQVASSDGFSADQLAAIQKQVQESLAKSGINTEILMGVSGGSEVIRRPNKPKGPKGGEKKNGAPKKNGSNLQLSIFE
ncbi:hypothetical protein PRIPAC_83250 [Pristionchus pacificus]|uniref:Uncharacterized protein n=1 Tax=Pristionchus pacificus TaxID=54126 RepID=A0A454Y5E5_PRIPA|nr:hypothetical protein PRIPAC_83250 [Pristionchus pacificus]|eukprot:PDM66987.1 hypothetical protein PRIPAC_48404 [Pristionchus pacificus]